MTKKRILVVNEFSLLSTGFSNYMRELLSRLYKSEKYEVAELSTYVNPLDPRIKEVPWKVYPNEPHPENKDLIEKYKAVRENQFGKFRFDEVCLDFKPHIVISIRDYWMDCWINDSPFRKYFKWVTMPTVDGEPQKVEWIETYKDADALLTYSLWAANLLENQSNKKIKVEAVASPGAEHDLFKPSDNKKLDKENFGLDGDIFLVQTVMRNQPRKLFPELMKAFNLFLDKCEKENRQDLAQKTYLYFHTSFPDLGWNIPEEIRKYKLSHKVLFTYACSNCGHVSTSFYSGEKCICKKCKNASCSPPNSSYGISRKDLAKIVSLSDVYVQYATNGGWEMGINEAKACGVPCLVVDYSAMSEQTTNGGAIPIKVQNFFQEPLHQTNQLRASPDNQDFADKLFEILFDDVLRENLGKEARECVERYYTYDIVAETWEKVLDQVSIEETDKTWLSDPKIIEPSKKIPGNCSNEDFLKYLYKNILMEEKKIYSFEYNKILQALDLGFEMTQNQEGKPIKVTVDRQRILNTFLRKVQYHNMLESARYNYNNPKVSQSRSIDYIEV